VRETGNLLDVGKLGKGQHRQGLCEWVNRKSESGSEDKSLLSAMFGWKKDLQCLKGDEVSGQRLKNAP